MAAPRKSIHASNPTAPSAAGRGKVLQMTYSPSGDRALHAIADELRRIGDALSRTANHVTAVRPAKPEAPAPAASASGTPAPLADATQVGAVQPAAPLSAQDEALFQALRQWRAEEARKLGMPPYIVATDKALRALVERRPQSVEELREVPGFGPVKAAKYGAGVVEVVAGA